MTDRKIFISEAEFSKAVAKAKEVCKTVMDDSDVSDYSISMAELHFSMLANILEIALFFGNAAADGAVDFAKAQMKKDRS